MVDPDAHASGTEAELALVYARLSEPQIGEDAFVAWAVTGVLRVITELRERLISPNASSPTRVAVVGVIDAQSDPWRAAAANGLCEALRGVIGSLTLERGPSLRLNLVLTNEEPSAALSDTLAFLAGDKSGFVAGSTFDLRSAG